MASDASLCAAVRPPSVASNSADFSNNRAPESILGKSLLSMRLVDFADGYSKEDLMYIWNSDSQVNAVDGLAMSQFSLQNITVSDGSKITPYGE